MKITLVFIIAFILGFITSTYFGPQDVEIFGDNKTFQGQDLQKKIESLILEAKKKDQKIIDIQQRVFMLLLAELGIKLSQQNLELILSGKVPIPTNTDGHKTSQTQQNKKYAEPSVSMVSSPYQTQNYDTKNNTNYKSSPIPKAYREYEYKQLFGIPRLFEKKTFEFIDDKILKNINGKYIGLVTFKDGTKAKLDISFKNMSQRQERVIELTVVSTQGVTLIDTHGPTKEFQILTYGPNHVPSVDEVQTALIILDTHYLSFAWPTDETHERGNGNMMEGYYEYKGKDFSKFIGKETGQLHFFRK